VFNWIVWLLSNLTIVLIISESIPVRNNVIFLSLSPISVCICVAIRNINVRFHLMPIFHLSHPILIPIIVPTHHFLVQSSSSLVSTLALGVKIRYTSISVTLFLPSETTSHTLLSKYRSTHAPSWGIIITRNNTMNSTSLIPSQLPPSISEHLGVQTLSHIATEPTAHFQRT